MDKYEVLNQIGDGTFGSVAKAVSKKTGQLVAIKRMKQKFYTWEECVKLPEVDVVRRIHRHPNIVKLTEVIRENNQLYFVFEYMDGDLLGVIKKAKQAQKPEDASSSPAISYPKVKHYMRQILQALAFVHKRGYFHRDMKPENLLIRKEANGEEVVKLADFGLVKEVRARPPFTDYVSTRWYRAPELLLQDRAYNAPVDIFAAGCIMSELITTKPLFPGSNEVDQLFRIMTILGSPTEKTWPDGFTLAKKIRYTFPSIHGSGLAKVLPSHIPSQAVDLMQQMLQYDPKSRPTAEQCLSHPYFNVGVDESNAASLEQRANATHALSQSPQSAPVPIEQQTANPDAKRFLTAQANNSESKAPGINNSQKYYMMKNRPDPSRQALENSATGSFPPSNALSNLCSPYKKKNTTQDNNGYKIFANQPSSLNSSSQPPPNKAGGASKPKTGEVDVDQLLSEFAGELNSQGIHAHKESQPLRTSENSNSVYRTPRQEPEGGSSLSKPPAHGGEQQNDPVTALLYNSRYKTSSFSGPSSNISPPRESGVDRGGVKEFIQHPPPKNNVKGVSPSIRALLAKRRKSGSGGFGFQ